MKQVCDFLLPLIQCSSITPDEAGTFLLLEEWLTALGFSCKRLKFFDTDNLYAVRGTTGPNFCFAGHVDVVPVIDESLWTHPPFKGVIDDAVVYGRGVVDMKGAIACYLKALNDFFKKKPNPSYRLSILLTSDEEGPALNGTVKVLQWLKQEGDSIDLCMVGEPTSEQIVADTIKIGRRGSLNANIKVFGKAGHVAYAQKAQNPIPEMLDLLTALKQRKFSKQTPFFDETRLEIVGIDAYNTTFNVIPHSCEARLNIRFCPSYTKESLINWIEKESKKINCETVVNFYSNADPFYSNAPAVHEKVKRAVAMHVNEPPVLSTTGGTSDARFIKDMCPVFELGLKNETAHQINERAPLSDLENLSKIYLEILCLFDQEGF